MLAVTLSQLYTYIISYTHLFLRSRSYGRRSIPAREPFRLNRPPLKMFAGRFSLSKKPFTSDCSPLSTQYCSTKDRPSLWVTLYFIFTVSSCLKGGTHAAPLILVYFRITKCLLLKEKKFTGVSSAINIIWPLGHSLTTWGCWPRRASDHVGLLITLGCWPHRASDHVGLLITWGCRPCGVADHVGLLTTWSCRPRGVADHVELLFTWRCWPRGATDHVGLQTTWGCWPRGVADHVEGQDGGLYNVHIVTCVNFEIPDSLLTWCTALRTYTNVNKISQHYKTRWIIN